MGQIIMKHYDIKTVDGVTYNLFSYYEPLLCKLADEHMIKSEKGVMLGITQSNIPEVLFLCNKVSFSNDELYFDGVKLNIAKKDADYFCQVTERIVSYSPSCDTFWGLKGSKEDAISAEICLDMFPKLKKLFPEVCRSVY